MPTQFPYPETGWSTGNMRMAKAGARGMDPGREFRELEGQRRKKETQVSEDKSQYPEISHQEYMEWLKEGAKQGGFYAPHRAIDVDNLMDKYPMGIEIDKRHPQLKDIEKSMDIFSITSSNDFLYARPRKLISEWEGPGPARTG